MSYNEPWVIKKKRGVWNSDMRPVMLYDHLPRIVACVNVCAGLTDAQVQALTDAGGVWEIIEALVYFRGSAPGFERQAERVLDAITDAWMELHRGRA